MSVDFEELVPLDPTDWFCHARLTCGHSVWWGWRSTEGATETRPRRADGSFGSVLCPYGCGRRRLVMYATSRTDVQGMAAIISAARRVAS